MNLLNKKKGTFAGDNLKSLMRDILQMLFSINDLIFF